MAREVLTRIWCDVCLADVEDGEEPTHTEAEETSPVTIGFLKPRVVALCEAHRKELFDPFDQLVRELGQPLHSGGPVIAAPTGSRPKAYPCPDPECEKHDDAYANASSLGGHAQRVHGMSLTELRVKFGVEPPGGTRDTEAARAAQVTQTETVTCGECGKVFEFPEYRVPNRARGVHLATVHGIKSKKPSNVAVRKNK